MPFCAFRAAERNAELFVFCDAELSEGEKFDLLKIVILFCQCDHGADFVFGIGEARDYDVTHPERYACSLCK